MFCSFYGMIDSVEDRFHMKFHARLGETSPETHDIQSLKIIITTENFADTLDSHVQ